MSVSKDAGVVAVEGIFQDVPAQGFEDVFLAAVEDVIVVVAATATILFLVVIKQGRSEAVVKGERLGRLATAKKKTFVGSSRSE